MTPPINIDGTDITGASIDGQDVSAITVDGTQVFNSVKIPTAGLVHRYDATKIGLSDGQDLGAWDDSVGSDNLTQSTAADQPTFDANGINSKGTVNADSGFLSVNFSTNISQPYQVIIVLRQSATAGGSGTDTLWSAFSNGVVYEDRVNSGNLRMFGGSVLDNSTETANTDPRLLATLWNSGNSNNRVDQTDTTGNAGSRSLDGLTISGKLDSSDSSQIRVGEVVVYDKELTSSELSDLESELIGKWGLPF